MARIVDTSKIVRIRDTSNLGVKVPADFIQNTFGARPVASTTRMDLLQLRDLMSEMLQSTGGRPSLSHSSDRVKLPKLESDWAAIEEISQRLAPQLVFKPSPAQVAAVMLHWAVSHMNEEDIKHAMKA
ncbi:hypothetical protein [Limnohabitans parvus]|uniref:Uncharacterized protein n=1 Tax=Limnohabitans parvus II-B4 TaxID=1293052 RepID=A0A315EFD1_9BURK|nr:hypothetical protein [Limnohabitans parvus]PUE55528.1 hypothetical protein B9Z37_02925 [Limnohabitans parvus II-B4]